MRKILCMKGICEKWKPMNSEISPPSSFFQTLKRRKEIFAIISSSFCTILTQSFCTAKAAFPLILNIFTTPNRFNPFSALGQRMTFLGPISRLFFPSLGPGNKTLCPKFPKTVSFHRGKRYVVRVGKNP